MYKNQVPAWLMLIAVTLVMGYLTYLTIQWGNMNWRFAVQFAVIEGFIVAVAWKDLRGRNEKES